ncbi:helix-turn-helix domain-containing protein [Aurantimonas sp. C2-6-R+9]|uniref:helix-turn-helix domain-containing protein n=1 Tax=unclassified Aurantimonas TaxID=2638230 RepID=UPI002E179EEA|nr:MULTISPECIES: helix-turn-helix domain-containing protein [unclassified Aurantimonas]MEC5293700.1 helix-turn-helix domain-containing protein [Aurantimonas sp. C2-3-R2]MEC5383282.1 helix-turn-helix domain-containing protein [Aurantimonas sp. C2-6-R+9]MEC5414248.1 helix-turn-helix domain-containing protein [Aurantimonas sp. C2-4-R8]
MSALDSFRPPVHPVTIIAREVARLRRVGFDDLMPERRTRNLVGPRQEAMYLAKKLTPASLPAIGRRLGGRDHTTILYGIRRTEARIADLVGYGDELEGLEAAITPKLPLRRNFDMVPAADIDPLDTAGRIRQALDDRMSVELFADEIGAMAAALIAASDRVRALSEQLAKRPTMTVAAPVMVRMLTDPGKAAARSVVAAWEAFQSARYSPRERFAVEHLHRSLSHLKAELSPAENQKDPCS